MSGPTGLVATVDVTGEAGVHRLGPRADAPDLVVESGAALRVALLAGRPGLELAAGRAAILAASGDIVLVLRADQRATLVERADALREARPDVVLALPAPHDLDALIDLAEALRLACAEEDPLPIVLVSGGERARARLAQAFGGFAIHTIADASRLAGREAIVARLRAIRRGDRDIVLRDEAVEAAARALASTARRAAIVVDVSGATTSLAHATESGEVSAVHVRVGVGVGADRVIARGGLDRVRRWIPRAVDAPALLERVFNRARWPGAVPTSALTLAIEMSLARECIAYALAHAERAGLVLAPFRDARLVACTGDLARFPRPAQTVLVVLDALAPTATQLVARERPDALVAAGALAARASGGAASTLEPLALVTVLSTRRAAIRIVDARGTTDEQASRGTLLLVPTAGAVELAVAGMPVATADALAVGVVVDGRGRPLDIPERDAERIPAVARWHAALDALPEGPP